MLSSSETEEQGALRRGYGKIMDFSFQKQKYLLGSKFSRSGSLLMNAIYTKLQRKPRRRERSSACGARAAECGVAASGIR
jgi:hypothetical protein